ncbi:hypothetical protein Cst_c19310 [Thermoclostridium stercorarium subsp. stercorarium DSM 8532]|jgi:type III restriction enzyme|uniref:Uncharacterized protein n=3 Tax=Thermoclostridium stercorarium TaxID=1510 RepID=L7VTK2_THES1|nr:hypothetical protein [Thermoclostridium stercorarium]AGC68908.1 hypothetical protein Cst_c19310 [Thermoclostridium stercorarium subsp. stercorarium DSM 8532]ANW99205.1 hypothetical protein CSTERTH_09295 [Thermoclostridium stercorarium subsp. thermolacticum DSM 2910]ANX01761.1 hypothetical protein CSTERLE_09350 [Thermoclostridium stercorarium subsp. leptospartum DSM 9219]UZQ84889.1 hypothetical protein ODU73_001964 [Thermoclostridium stercorarium]
MEAASFFAVSKFRNVLLGADSECKNQCSTFRSGSSLYGLFNDENVIEHKARYTKQIKLKDLPLNIHFGAMDCYELLKFNVLKKYYPLLKSKREFLTSPSYVGNVILVIESGSEYLTANDLFLAAKKALGAIAKHIGGITQEYEGTKEFYAQLIRNVRNRRSRSAYLCKAELFLCQLLLRASRRANGRLRPEMHQD